MLLVTVKLQIHFKDKIKLIVNYYIEIKMKSLYKKY